MSGLGEAFYDRGLQAGEAMGLLRAIKGLMSSMNWGVDEAMEKMRLSPAQRTALRAHFA